MSAPPNYTQIPNDILGNILPGNQPDPGLLIKMKEADLKVYLVVARMTFGYHQTQRRASIQLIMKLTGLSRQSIYTAVGRLRKLNLIKVIKDGGVTLWQANVQNLDTENEQSVQNLDTECQKFRPPSKKETINKPKDSLSKDKADKQPSALEPQTKHELMLFEMVNHERVDAKNWRRVTKFPSLACKQKFDAAANALNGSTEQAIKAALENGILSIPKIVNYVNGWKKNANRYSPTNRTKNIPRNTF